MTYEQAWVAELIVAAISTLIVLFFQLWAYRRAKHGSLAMLILASFTTLLAVFFSLLSRMPEFHAISFYASAGSWFVSTVLWVIGSVSLLRWLVALASPQADA